MKTYMMTLALLGMFGCAADEPDTVIVYVTQPGDDDDSTAPGDDDDDDGTGFNPWGDDDDDSWAETGDTGSMPTTDTEDTIDDTAVDTGTPTEDTGTGTVLDTGTDFTVPWGGTMLTFMEGSFIDLDALVAPGDPWDRDLIWTPGNPGITPSRITLQNWSRGETLSGPGPYTGTDCPWYYDLSSSMTGWELDEWEEGAWFCVVTSSMLPSAILVTYKGTTSMQVMVYQ